MGFDLVKVNPGHAGTKFVTHGTWLMVLRGNGTHDSFGFVEKSPILPCLQRGSSCNGASVI